MINILFFVCVFSRDVDLEKGDGILVSVTRFGEINMHRRYIPFGYIVFFLLKEMCFNSCVLRIKRSMIACRRIRL